MNLITLVPPPVEPVTLADIYTFLRLDPAGSPPQHPDDAMLASMITAAREKVEATTRRALVRQTLRLVLPSFPRYRVRSGFYGDDPDMAFWRDAPIELPKPPFAEVLAVRYYGEGNTPQTVDAGDYFVASEGFTARVEPGSGFQWPASFGRQDAVQIDYVAGHAPDGSPPDYAANIPESLVTAVKLEVQLMYDELAPEKRRDIENTIARLVRSYVVPKF